MNTSTSELVDVFIYTIIRWNQMIPADFWLWYEDLKPPTSRL